MNQKRSKFQDDFLGRVTAEQALLFCEFWTLMDMRVPPDNEALENRLNIIRKGIKDLESKKS